MTRWLISVPVWGERCVEEFCAAALPALERAVNRLAARRSDIEVRLIVHTDAADRIRGATSVPVDERPVPVGARDFDSMSQAHREVLGLGMRGDVVVLFTGGAVISERGLEHCAQVLDDHRKKLVLCAVPRVLPRGRMPETGDAQALMRWGWNNRHPMVDECTWPGGRSVDLSRTYYADAARVVTLQALPHPLAVRVDGRPLRFTPTVDANLMHCFDPREMHMVADCRRLAMLKLSPADKGFDLAPHTMAERAAMGQLIIGNQHQRWCLSHSVTLCEGPGEPPHAEFVAALRP